MTKKKVGRKKKVGAKPIPLSKRHVYTLEELRARCGAEDNEECWDNYVGMHGQVPASEHGKRYPVVVHGGVVKVIVRRLAWFLAYGEDPPEGMMLVMTKCHNPRCQNPYHAKPMPESEKSRVAASRGHFSSMTRRMKIAAAKQATGKLNWDKVREIRACTIPFNQQPWTKWGISQSMWKQIRSNKAWVDFNSPMARMVA